jgi:4-hydroxy-tetrahydrodipicolinate synthase
MGTKGQAFAGVSVAIVTPFKNDQVDYDCLKQQIEFQIAAGVNCLCPVGTTGESPTLSHDEHERVIAFVCETVDGRIKVMPGTGSNSTAEALRLTKSAEKAGADAALQVAPYYNKPTQTGFYEHFKRLAEETSLPQCIYNIPGRTGKNIEPDTIIRLAELQNIALVKEATGSLDQASAILANTNLTVLSGDDSLTLPILAVGGSGVISVVANIVPKDMIAMITAFAAGKIDEAREIHHKLFPLCRDMLGLSTNPIPIKAAMKMLGRDTGELRLPMTPLSKDEEVSLRKTLTK